MLLPLSTPSTPLHRLTKENHQFSRYTAPVRSKVHGVPLPPHQLPEVISEISLRRPNPTKLFASPNSNPRSAAGPQLGVQAWNYGSRKSSNVSSRSNTPTRRLSSHLSIRRRRRSSTGVLYDSAYAGKITKDFLRDMAKALVREKQVASEEPGDKVFKALDQQFRLNSTSPNAGTKDYDYSLPLPSDNDLLSSDDMTSHQLDEIKPPKSEPQAKPAFKSYLERIIELRGKKAKHSKPFHSIFDLDSPDSILKHEHINDNINTSSFVIENTLSGLADIWNKVSSSDSTMKLAEPVAFGSMNDVDSSYDSSEKESLPQPATVQQKSARDSQIGLGTFTPNNYDRTNFQNISLLDIPSYDPVPIYDHDTLKDQELAGVNSFDKTSEAVNSIMSDPNETDMIQGHFTIDDDKIDQVDPFLPGDDIDLTRESTPVASHSVHSQQNATIRKVSKSKRHRSVAFFPNNLVKGFASIAQNLSAGNIEAERSLKRRKHTLRSSYLNLIALKSEEFLESVMRDLTAYAEHRNSREINISDAVLYFNRIQSFEFNGEESMNFASTSRSIFPLECLQSLDNSLQAAAMKSLRGQKNAMESDDNLAWNDDEDYTI